MESQASAKNESVADVADTPAAISPSASPGPCAPAIASHVAPAPIAPSKATTTGGIATTATKADPSAETRSAVAQASVLAASAEAASDSPPAPPATAIEVTADPSAAPADATTPVSPAARQRSRLKRLLPWLSLVFGLASAALMDRSPGRAVLVVIAASVGWGMLVAQNVLRTLSPESLSPWRARALRAGKFASLSASQSLIQLPIFFALPFYFRASVLTPGHIGFVVLLAGAGAATLWDPLFEVLARRRSTTLPLQATACFAGLNAVLPMIGLSNRASLWAAAAATVVGLPLAAAGASARGTRIRAALLAGGVALALPLLLALGAARAIPAAPLRLVEASIGTRLARMAVEDPVEELKAPPSQLVCATAIWAPAGLKDALFHVWRRDGVPVDRIPLRLSGGRDAGFRTWSIKRSLRPTPEGNWTCAVETANGQVLGARTITIRGSVGSASSR